MLKRLKKWFENITGLKLRYKMFLVYILGGALPMILISLYLFQGISRILIEQAEQGEISSLEMIRSQAEEMFSTVSTVTKYFYFDPQLEAISEKQYDDYQDVVDDYKEYTGFLDYARYYNSLIGWINIYMENETITGNSRFVKVTEEMKEEEWYRAAKAQGGRAVWRYHQVPSSDQNALAMLRLLRTSQGENVGILSVYIRPERFQTLLRERDCDTFVLLNGKIMIAGRLGQDLQEENVEQEEVAGLLDEISEFLPLGENGQSQKNIFLDKNEYVMTCETISLVESEDYLQIVSLRSYKSILRKVNGQNARSLLLLGVSVMISVSVILGFSHSFSSRVEQFRIQMRRAAEGNFELEENIGGNDEISSLYDYLKNMIGEIQRLLSEIYREKLHADRLTIQQKDAEFKMLASQINPHFLYNTLETIRMRARKSRQSDIEEIVKMLAKIMRSYLQAGETETSLRSEIELVEYYLKIQQYRFGERIQYQIYVEEGLQEYRILPLVIQPIVENSIIHGLESKEGVGTIRISVQTNGDKVIISVEDDGAGISAEKLKIIRQRMERYDENGRHIGVSNVHQRVKLRYGGEYGVEISSIEGEFTRVDMILPSAEKYAESQAALPVKEEESRKLPT